MKETQGEQMVLRNIAVDYVSPSLCLRNTSHGLLHSEIFTG